MSDPAALKDEIKKLNARATQKKMDLHDLSEELPQNWERILEVAAETYDAFKVLSEKRAALKALE
ncbi:CCE_0567 family metalloprotein [Azospirillum sp. ST 5-10]|uniref:CCE_0567 family metalloprotein n=1 Tax=unclassified Azospirillum TaxID=2630922 RepID=UPI003F4A5376